MLHHMLRAAAGNRGGIPTDGLVAWYTMDNISGSTLVDEMGNYDGELFGPTQITGLDGQALSFDGSSDNLKLAGTSAIGTTFAMSAWINPSIQGGVEDILFQQMASASAGRLIFISGGELHLSSRDGSGNYIEASPVAVTAGIWQHFYAHEVGGELLLSVDNGTPNTTTLGSPSSPSADMYVGYDQRDNDRQYAGGVDQMRIYNEAKTADERQALYEEFA